MWVHRLVDADHTCGGKAVRLGAMARAGLPVPAGFAISGEAFRTIVGTVEAPPAQLGHALDAAATRLATTAVPEMFLEAVDRAVDALGEGDLVVRSSATIEDSEVGSAAGVLTSVIGVHRADLWAAIRAVWTSAVTPLAAAYARHRRVGFDVGVIVQLRAPGELVTIYTRPPGAPAEDVMLRQDARGLARVPRDESSLAIRAARAIGATTGADVEIVGDAVVQARPLVHRTSPARTPPPPAVIASLVRDGRVWTWDVTHNPDPLSTAQTELVELVERAAIAPWSLAVCAGFLYSTPRRARASDIEVEDVASVEARVAAIEERLEHLTRGSESISFETALDRYVAFYAIWTTELSPLVAAVKRRWPPHGGRRPSSVEATLLRAARGELDFADVVARIGVLSPAWDVATPTYAERPEQIALAIERARIATRTREVTPTIDRAIDFAAELSDRDDLWFARAQWLVRAALQSRGDRLGLDGDDVFWLPFDVLATARDHDLDDLRRRASAARTAATRAARWDMPLTIDGATRSVASDLADGSGRDVRPPRDISEDGVLRGSGLGARVTGRVVRVGALAAPVLVGRGDVIVARAITPALAVAVIGCAAIVCETGGLLDHGAALARELGVPCVVGCANAWKLLADGEIVIVDGSRGLVTRAQDPRDRG